MVYVATIFFVLFIAVSIVLFKFYLKTKIERRFSYFRSLPQDRESLIVAVDFDNTIAYTDWPEIIEEVPGAIRALNRMQQQGHVVILWTCREQHHLQHALIWLSERGFYPDGANTCAEENNGKWEFDSRKIGADVYIDDRSFGHHVCWKTITLAFDDFHRRKNGKA